MPVSTQSVESFFESMKASQRTLTANLNDTEKWLSIAAGAYLGVKGLSRGGPSGLLATGLAAGLLYRGLTGHCYLYDQLGIDTTEKSSLTVIPAQQGVHVKKSVTIAKPIEEVFRFWDDVENLPRFMTHIISVTTTGESRSHWIAEAPLGLQVEWDAEVFNRVPNELIAWQSLPGGAVQSVGSIRFAEQPNGRGTSVTLNMKYNPTGGKVTDAIAGLFGRDLASEIDGDLRNFKRLLEAGELPTVDGQTHGPRSSLSRML